MYFFYKCQSMLLAREAFRSMDAEMLVDWLSYYGNTVLTLWVNILKVMFSVIFRFIDKAERVNL